MFLCIQHPTTRIHIHPKPSGNKNSFGKSELRKLGQ